MSKQPDPKSPSRPVAPGLPEPQTKADRELAARLGELPPEHQEMFLRALALAMRKRRVLLLGYCATVLSLVLGWVWALYIYGKTRDSGEFMAWVFLVPPAVAATVLILFGRLSRGLRE